MAKRFTDTEKWKKEWFRKLPLKMKVTWEYLRDNCNHAGIWEPDFDLMSFQVGERVTREECLKHFGEDRFVALASGKFYLPGFAHFQYGHLGNSKVHKSIEEILLKERVNEHLDNSKVPVQDKDKETDKEKDNQTKTKRTKQEYSPGFEEIYDLYPRREGKSRAFKIYERDVQSEEDRANLIAAINNYKKAKASTGEKYLLYFSTFMGEWRDWLDPRAGTVSNAKPQKLYTTVEELEEALK